MKTIGIIGFGNMGSALALGVKDKGYTVAVSEQKEELTRLASEEYGFKVFSAAGDMINISDLLVIAVKPQDIEDLAAEIGSSLSSARVISIMAGRSIPYLTKLLKPAALARFMPNLAARERKAMVGIAFSDTAGQDFRNDCLAVAGAIGMPCEVPEKLMSAFTGLSSSGIAYVFSFLHAMALGGVKVGFTYAKALEISAGTVDGALELVRKSGENPVEWVTRVASPAGTTIQGIAALEESGFSHGIIQAIERASKRAEELES